MAKIVPLHAMKACWGLGYSSAHS